MSDLMSLCDFFEFCTDEPTSQGEREKDTADPGVIVGIVVGVVVVVVAIIVTMVMCRRQGCLPPSQEKRYTLM